MICSMRSGRCTFEDDPPFPFLDLYESLVSGCRVKESDIDEFFQAGLEFFLEFTVVVGATESNVFAGERSKVELQMSTAVESFIEESVRLSCTWGFELEVGIQIDSFEVVGLKGGEDDAIPGDRRKDIPSAFGSTVQIDGFEDAERFAIPSLVISVPPGLFVVEGD